MSPIESALVVLVPEAERLVKPFCERYDPSAAAGVPAHITLLYPSHDNRTMTTDCVAAPLQVCSSRHPVPVKRLQVLAGATGWAPLKLAGFSPPQASGGWGVSVTDHMIVGRSGSKLR